MLIIYPLDLDHPVTQTSVSEAIFKKRKKFFSIYRGEFMALVNSSLFGVPLLFLILTGQTQAFFWTSLGLQWIWEYPSSLGALASQFA